MRYRMPIPTSRCADSAPSRARRTGWTRAWWRGEGGEGPVRGTRAGRRSGPARRRTPSTARPPSSAGRSPSPWMRSWPSAATTSCATSGSWTSSCFPDASRLMVSVAPGRPRRPWPAAARGRCSSISSTPVGTSAVRSPRRVTRKRAAAAGPSPPRSGPRRWGPAVNSVGRSVLDSARGGAAHSRPGLPPRAEERCMADRPTMKRIRPTTVRAVGDDRGRWGMAVPVAQRREGRLREASVGTLPGAAPGAASFQVVLGSLLRSHWSDGTPGSARRSRRSTRASTGRARLPARTCRHRRRPRWPLPRPVRRSTRR